MKIIIFLTFPLLFATNTFASCPDKIWDDKGWKDVPLEVKSCIMESDTFTNAIINGQLCTDDKLDVSDEYKKYLDYKQTFDAKLEEYRNEENSAMRQFLADELRAIERDWLIFGYRVEIQNELSLAFSKQLKCLGR